MVSASARRQQVEYARKRGRSLRKACRLVGIARSTMSYRSKLDEADAPILKRMTELARQYPRYG